MKLETALEIVRKYAFYITITEFADGLCLSSQTVRKRLKNDSDLTYDEAGLLAKHFQVPIKLFFKVEELPSTILVDYFDFSKRHANFEKYFMDFKIAYQYKRYLNPKDLKLYMLEGNRLEQPFGLLTIKSGDVLLCDTSETEPKKDGLYVYTCHDNYHNVAYISENCDGSLNFSFTNPKETQVRTPKQLYEYGFKIRGRVLKNLFFFH